MNKLPAPLLLALFLGSVPAVAQEDGGAAAPTPKPGHVAPRDAGTPAAKTEKAEKADPGKAATVEGGISKDIIIKVLKRHQNEIRSCYDQASRSRPTLAGKVAVKFIVGGAGDVLDAEIASDTLNDENTSACMLTVVRTWKFPEPQGGGNTSITYPWVFGPAK